MTTFRMSAPPLPRDAAEARRVEHTRLRRRVVYDMHREDVLTRMAQVVGTVRRDAWPPPDLSSNPARHVYSQLAGLYRSSPEVTPPEGAELVAASMAESGLWSLMQRVQRDTLALREMLVRVDIVDEEPVYRPVFPDMVEIEVDPARPSRLLSVAEWIPHGDSWARLVTDIRNGGVYRAESPDGQDISSEVIGGRFEGQSFPWMVQDAPVMPYVAYHAAETGHAWDAYTGAGVIDGTLSLAVYYTLLAHVLADASWAQRYAIGVEVDGLSAEAAQAEVTTDPATLLMLRAQADLAGQPVVGQWAAPLDPSDLINTIEKYERRLVDQALGQVGVTRRDSDVRSAMSLAVSRESQREAQAAYEPLFRRADLQLIRLTAGLLGASQDGWRINYRALPKEARELQAETDRLISQIEAGLIDRVSAYQQLHPGLTRPEAEAAVQQIAQINRQYAA